MSPCVGTWPRVLNRLAMLPSLRCWYPTGPSSTLNGFRMPRPGLNAMPPMRPVWALSVCATGSSPQRAKPCGLVQWWPGYPLNQLPGRMPTTGPIASFSLMELVVNVLIAARSVRLPRPATTRRSVGSTWRAPESM